MNLKHASLIGPERRRPSVLAAFRWEIGKAGNLWYWLASLLFDALGIFNGWSQYVSYRQDFQQQGVTWAAVWGQAMLLPSMVFIPVLVAAFAAQTEVKEHQGRNWQRLNASGTSGAARAAKMLHGLVASFLTIVIFELEFVLAGKFLLGFDPGELSPYLLRGIPMTLAVWAIMTITQAVASKCESFAGTMSIMLMLTLAGCALSLLVPALALPYPLALITSASSVRNLDALASPQSMILSIVVSLLWVLIGALLFRRWSKSAK
ncbi:ABC transporter permease [Bifidobacterium aemilianum]|uniref:ABC transporter permease n=2 Tax=Bifidobacterium aemilianum TaxID=2493120 RepID=A0A366KAT3_9BIFI|nr:ABC transporter permease [Bifidobacterium aemilianum]